MQMYNRKINVYYKQLHIKIDNYNFLNLVLSSYRTI